MVVDQYTSEVIADSDCTADDVYSWDAPFESTQTIQCNGTAKPINEFFGGNPGQRKYTLADGPKKDTYFGFNGCAAVLDGKTFIFFVLLEQIIDHD